MTTARYATPDARQLGLALKARGVERVVGTHPDFVPRLRAAAKAYALAHGSVHIDDVRRLADELGLRPRHSAAWGAIFADWGWRKVGERASEIPSNHGHRSPVWQWIGGTPLLCP